MNKDFTISHYLSLMRLISFLLRPVLLQVIITAVCATGLRDPEEQGKMERAKFRQLKDDRNQCQDSWKPGKLPYSPFMSSFLRCLSLLTGCFPHLKRVGVTLNSERSRGAFL